MATATIYFNSINASLQESDNVFYMTPMINGAYTTADSFGSKWLGKVKSIEPPRHPGHTIYGVRGPFFNRSFIGIYDATQSYGGTNVVYQSDGSMGTFNPNWLDNTQDVEVGNKVYIARTLSPYTIYNYGDITITSLDAISTTDTRRSIQFSGNVGGYDGGSAPDNASLVTAYFSTEADAAKKIYLNNTDGIEVGNTVYATGATGWPVNCVVQTISTNNYITVDKHCFVDDEFIDLEFKENPAGAEDEFYKVVVEIQESTPVANPADNDYFFFQKDKSANHSGVLGYYAEVKISNSSTSKSELFSVSTEVTESSK